MDLIRKRRTWHLGSTAESDSRLGSHRIFHVSSLRQWKTGTALQINGVLALFAVCGAECRSKNWDSALGWNLNYFQRRLLFSFWSDTRTPPTYYKRPFAITAPVLRRSVLSHQRHVTPVVHASHIISCNSTPSGWCRRVCAAPGEYTGDRKELFDHEQDCHERCCRKACLRESACLGRSFWSRGAWINHGAGNSV